MLYGSMVKICIGNNLKQESDCVVDASTRSSCCSIWVAISALRDMKGLNHVATLGIQGLEYVSTHFILNREYCG